MTDRPSLFSAPMVRATLREIEQPGTGKTQTRRVLTDQPVDGARFHGFDRDGQALFAKGCAYGKQRLRYAVGDRLYVREAWHAARSLDSTPPREIPRDADIEYAATARSYAEIGLKGKLRPGMFLPRWASRITLIVSDVRVQRLQEISEDDAVAEGVERDSDGWRDYQMPTTQCCATARDSFRTLWDSLNAARGYGWDANPWIAAVSFTVERRNIDQVQP